MPEASRVERLSARIRATHPDLLLDDVRYQRGQFNDVLLVNGELVFRFKRAVPGVVLLRIDPEKSPLKWTRLEAAIAKFAERLFGRFLVIERLGSAHGLRSINEATRTPSLTLARQRS